MSLFLNSKFINFREFATRKYDLFSLAKDRQTGEIFMTGNSQLALDHLKNLEKLFRTWVIPRSGETEKDGEKKEKERKNVRKIVLFS